MNKKLEAFQPFMEENENINESISLEQLMKRPNVTYEQLREAYDIPKLSQEIERYIETEVKYEGYIKIQAELLEKQKKVQDMKIPEDFDFSLVNNISMEAKDRLKRVKPINVGQAARISGVNPSDVSFLIIYLTKKSKQEKYEKQRDEEQKYEEQH